MYNNQKKNAPSDVTHGKGKPHQVDTSPEAVESRRESQSGPGAPGVTVTPNVNEDENRDVAHKPVGTHAQPSEEGGASRELPGVEPGEPPRKGGQLPAQLQGPDQTERQHRRPDPAKHQASGPNVPADPPDEDIKKDPPAEAPIGDKAPAPDAQIKA